MAYGSKYTLGFLSEKFGHSYDIDVQLDGYIGEIIPKRLGSAPLLRKDSSDNGRIMGTSLEMAIQADADFELIGFYTADNRKHKVNLKKNGVVIWSGYVLPEQYQEPYVAPPYDVVVTASDGLGTLKDIDFDLTGKSSFLAIIKHCVDKLGLGFGFEVASDLWEVNMDRTNTGLNQGEVETFVYEGMSCYEVLEEVLSGIDACVTQVNAKWFIGRYVDIAKAHENYGSDLIKTGTGNPQVLEMGQVGSDCYPIGQLEFDVQNAVKKLTIKKDYKFYPSFIENYDFTNWDNGWSFPNGEKYININSSKVGGVLYIWGSRKSDCATQEFQVDQTTEATYLYVVHNHVYADAPMDYKIKMIISLVGSGVTWYLTNKGWTTSSGKIYMEGSGSRELAEDNWKTFELKADGFPVSGTLKIELYGDVLNEYVLNGGTRGAIYSEVIFRTIPAAEGVELTGLFNEKASQAGDDVNISFGDRPDLPNKEKMFANNITLPGGAFAQSWQVGNSGTDSYINILMRSLASRFGSPYKILTGTLQGENLHFGSLIHHAHNDSIYFIKEGEYNLLEDEMTVTLLELPVYNNLPLTVTDVPLRTSSSKSSEHRSVDGTDYRVFAPESLGAPKRITDLASIALSELTDQHVFEIDKLGLTGSKQVDLGTIKSYLTNDIDFSSLAKLVGGNNFEGIQNIVGDLNVTGKHTNNGDVDVIGNQSITGNLDIEGIHTVNGDMHVNGYIYQHGEIKAVIAEHVTVNDEFINLRGDATVAIGPGMISGFNIAKYDGIKNLLLGGGSDGLFRFGHEGGTLVAALGREDNPLEGIFEWDPATKKAIGVGVKVSELARLNGDKDEVFSSRLLAAYAGDIRTIIDGNSIRRYNGSKYVDLPLNAERTIIAKPDGSFVAKEYRSADYSTGTTGYYIGNDLIEGQNLRIRGSFACTDLVAERKRAINGGLRICKASGKIKSVETYINSSNIEYYKITLEAPCNFAGCIMLCQTYTNGNDNKYYRASVNTAYSNGVLYTKKAYFTDHIPEVGDDIVADNGDYIDLVSQSTERQYIAFVGDGIDYMRQGNLTGYTTEALRGLAGKNAAGDLTFLISPTKNIFSGEVNVIGGNVYNKDEVNSVSNTAKNEAVLSAALDATDKVNAVKIGATNLLQNSEEERVYTDGTRRLVYSPDVSEGEYVFSVDVKGEGWVYIYNGNYSEILATIPIFNYSEYTREYVKFSIASDTPTPIKINFYRRNLEGVILSCKKFKLEAGNKATDWTPSPEDVQTYTDNSVQNTKDLIASKFGYTDYNQLMNEAINGNTLVKGGYINTSLIQADAAFINLVQGTAFDFTKGAVGGYTIEDGILYHNIGTYASEYSRLGIQSKEHLYQGKGFGMYLSDGDVPDNGIKIINIGQLHDLNNHTLLSGEYGFEIIDKNRNHLIRAGANGLVLGAGVTLSWSQITDTTAFTDSVAAASVNAQSAYNLANTAKGDAATAQTKADDAYNLASTKDDAWVTSITQNTVTTSFVEALNIKILGDVVGGTFNLGSGNFSVNEEGKLTTKFADIANWQVREGILKSVAGNFVLDSNTESMQITDIHTQTLNIKTGALTPILSGANTVFNIAQITQSFTAIDLNGMNVDEQTFTYGTTYQVTQNKIYEFSFSDVTMGVDYSVLQPPDPYFYGSFSGTISIYIEDAEGNILAKRSDTRSFQSVDDYGRAWAHINADSMVFTATATTTIYIKFDVRLSYIGPGSCEPQYQPQEFNAYNVRLDEKVNFSELTASGAQWVNNVDKFFKVDINADNILEIMGAAKLIGNLEASSVNEVVIKRGSFMSTADGNQFVPVDFPHFCYGAVCYPIYNPGGTNDFGCGMFANIWGDDDGFWVNRNNAFDGAFNVMYVAFGY